MGSDSDSDDTDASDDQLVDHQADNEPYTLEDALRDS